MDIKQMIESAFSQAEYAINITDPEGKLIKVNQAYLRLYKFSNEDEILGKNQRIIRSSKTPPNVYKVMWKTILSGESWRGDLSNKATDGSEVFIHLTISPIYENSKLMGFMGFSLDRKQQVLLERQLLHANKLVILGTLGASLAHELNNPLTSILLETEYLRDLFDGKEKIIDTKAAAEAANSAIRGVDRMRRVLEHLLQYARKDSQLSTSTIRLKEMIEDSFLFMEKQLANRGIHIKLQLDSELFIVGNKTQLESVIHNLLTNSRDAFDGYQPSGKKLIKIHCYKSDEDMVTLEFRDNAGGIPKDHLDKIWDPFFTTKSEEKGTGLGLAISRKIIIEHNGSIYGESKGDTSTFYIRLPLSES